MTGPPSIVRLHRVRKAFQEGGRERVLLRDVDAVVPEGLVTVIAGRSGSGKTTVLNLMSGIDVPDRGHVEVAGRRLDRLSDRERTWLRRTAIGFVFQFFNLVPTLSALENVRLPLELQGVGRSEAGRRAAEELARVGLAARAGAYPDRLSGGEQQRVAVARALVHRPRLVLADEPTGNLDGETAAAVLGLLTGLVTAERRTLVMATHSEEAAARADLRLELRDGRLVPGGPAGLAAAR